MAARGGSPDPVVRRSLAGERHDVTDPFDPSGPRPDQDFSTGPEPTPERGFPQGGPVHPQEPAHVVSRETSVSSPTFVVRTAADVAAAAGGYGDETTPLARAAEHSVLARQPFGDRPRLRRPDGTRVMVVANQKGGVGKTTTTVNLAAALTQLGQSVLVVDLDPQGNASTALSVDHHRGTPSTYDLLVNGATLEEVVTDSPEVEGLAVVPATIDLAGAEIELVSVVARESRLQKALAAHPRVGSAEEAGEDRFDYVLIDCPPSLGLLTLNALVAGVEMLIPIQAEYYALEGLGQLLETVEMVRKHLNQRLEVSTILITMYDARTRLAAGVAQEVRDHFGDTVLRTAIPRSVRVSEAPSYGQTVMTYDPGSSGALSYLEAAREMAGKGVGA
ncbi:ParA family protein [Nocardioides guangzhouensis]|uniref:ParA family protein n=1 Tax=Nocardioides guangzhouensis TaxID=2497878 RepID=A0A4Q4Z7F8_9ACTN|nr:ParA family protein [Nocardioides guangzhouensis]